MLAMREYLATEPPEKLARLADEELRKAIFEIDERDYQTAIKLDRSDKTDLDQLESAYRNYLEKHPDGARRLDVMERLEQIPVRRDDRAFALAQANAAGAGEDLGLQEAAWLVYLETFPDGLHAVQARSEIARIPDRIDERRYRDLLSEIEPLIVADRITNALIRLEAGAVSIQSPQRQALIREKMVSLENQLEQGDAASCLEMSVADADERRQAAGACRLYLLCYPNGANRPSVEKRLHDLLAKERDELLAALRTKLSTIGDDPLAILAALDEYRRKPAASDGDVLTDIARNHLELLDRSVRASLQDMRVITLHDGTTLIGKAFDASPGWVQVKPRVIGDGEASPSRLVRSSEITVAVPPLLQTMDALHDRTRQIFAAAHPDVGALLAAVSAAMPKSDDELYKPERMACLTCLVGLDPTNSAARDELTAAGYVQYNGVYRPAIAAAESAKETDSPQQTMLEYFRVYCQENAPIETLRARLAESFDYSFLGTILTIPIEWDLTEPNCEPVVASGPSDPFNATLVFTYPTRSRRTSDSTLPASILTELDRELARLNQETRIQVIFEIKTSAERLTGVGIATRPRDVDLIVNRVSTDSSAARAGVEPGDRIALVDHQPLPDNATAETLAALIANSPVDGVEFAFVRAGRRYHVTLERGDYVIDKYQMRTEIETRGPLSKQNENSISEWIDLPAPP